MHNVLPSPLFIVLFILLAFLVYQGWRLYKRR